MGDAYEKEREKEKEKSRQSNQWGNRAIPSVRQVKRRSNTPRANGEPAVTNDDWWLTSGILVAPRLSLWRALGAEEITHRKQNHAASAP